MIRTGINGYEAMMTSEMRESWCCKNRQLKAEGEFCSSKDGGGGATSRWEKAFQSLL